MPTGWKNAALPATVVVCALVALAVGATRSAAGVDARALGPDDDARVLERLPPGADRRLRTALAASPEDPTLAAELARGLIRQARAAADPRYLGQAQAVLRRWWDRPAPPHDILVLRATIKQSLHDFTNALADLRVASEQDASDPQAWLTRAVLEQLLGDLDAARQSCRRLAGLAHPVVVAACVTGVDGASGHARDAAAALARAIDAGGRDLDAATRGWALTLLAELTARGGADGAAEVRFRQALTATPDDAYLLAAFADFLLDHRRPAEVTALLAGHDADNLLLRRAIAASRVDAAAAAPLIATLGSRHAAARLRGDRVHLREEARYLLELARRPADALAVAAENFAIQREPADTRLLLEAAVAAGDSAAARPAIDFVARTGMEDPAIAAALRRLEVAR